MNHDHFIIPIGSKLWLGGIIASLTFMILVIFIGKKLKKKDNHYTGYFLGSLFLFFAIGRLAYEYFTGRWDISWSLPLQLCSMSGILSGLVFFWPNQKAYELLVFWGIPGAIHSLLTPEMSHGYTDFLVVDYYVTHSGIIISSVYLAMVHERTIRPGSWLSSFVFTLFVIAGVGLINKMLNANYMYLCKKPMADNPLVIGEWPWYVGVLLLAGLVHFILVYLGFGKLGWIAETKSQKKSS